MKTFLFISLLQLIISNFDELFDYTREAIKKNSTKINFMIIAQKNIFDKINKKSIEKKMEKLYLDKTLSNNILLYETNTSEKDNFETLVNNFTNYVREKYSDKKNYILIAFEINNNKIILKRGENVKYLSNDLDGVLNKVAEKNGNYSKTIDELITTIQEIYGKNFSLFNILVVYLIIVCILLLVIVSLRFCSFKRGSDSNRDSDLKYTSMTRINTRESSSPSVVGTIN